MNATFKLQERLPQFAWWGEIKVRQAVPDSNGSTNKLLLDKPWEVKWEWKTDGWLTNLLAGEWVLRHWLETNQGGKVQWPHSWDSEPWVSGPHVYTKLFKFEPGLAPEGEYLLHGSISLRRWKESPGELVATLEPIRIWFVRPAEAARQPVLTAEAV